MHLTPIAHTHVRRKTRTRTLVEHTHTWQSTYICLHIVTMRWTRCTRAPRYVQTYRCIYIYIYIYRPIKLDNHSHYQVPKKKASYRDTVIFAKQYRNEKWRRLTLPSWLAHCTLSRQEWCDADQPRKGNANNTHICPQKKKKKERKAHSLSHTPLYYSSIF